MIDQAKFLSHPNFNGQTRSMSELQKTQQDLWANTFTAAVNHGRDSYVATQVADAAIVAFNARFVPPFYTTPDS
jgi:hypothetical protein